jgi:hypothetical protein
MRCLTCGAEVAEGRQYCDCCAPLAGGAPTPSSASDALSKIVPYKNTPALIGYYSQCLVSFPASARCWRWSPSRWA